MKEPGTDGLESERVRGTPDRTSGEATPNTAGLMRDAGYRKGPSRTRKGLHQCVYF